MRAVARHLGHFDTGAEAELRQGRRYAVSARLARLFAAYAVQRPTLLADWLDGRATDGRGGDLDDDLAWQPELWRRLVDRVGAPPPHRRHATPWPGCATSRRRSTCPDRLSLFGHTRLPVTEVELLDALAAHRDVHLWLPHPSGALWDALADRGRRCRRPRRRRQPPARRPPAAGHPRPRQPRAAAGAGRGPGRRPSTPAMPPRRRTPCSAGCRTTCAATPSRPAGRVLAAGDRSVQVHACHGAGPPGRRAARGAARHCSQADPTLEPRDILVMCPDIETYAPLITAGFGLGDARRRAATRPTGCGSGSPTGRSPRPTRCSASPRSCSTSPAAGPPPARCSTSPQAEPVRRRFGFTDDDLDTITTWVRESGVRWAFDARAPRRRSGWPATRRTPGASASTGCSAAWSMSDDAQRLARHHAAARRRRQHPHRAGRPVRRVRRPAAARSPTASTAPGRSPTGWTRSRDGDRRAHPVGRDDELAGRPGAARAGRGGRRRRRPWPTPRCGCPTSARCWPRTSPGRPTRANFRTGTLTVCTMVPMRSVPHRVVCLLGLDDGVFPRFGLVDGDDVLARDARSPASATCAARTASCCSTRSWPRRESLVVTYTGANEHTGQPRPPAVPLGELLDALDRTTEAPVRDDVVVEHPLQPFDRTQPRAGPARHRRAVHLRPDRAGRRPAPRPAAGRRSRVPGRPAGAAAAAPTTSRWPTCWRSSATRSRAFFRSPRR